MKISLNSDRKNSKFFLIFKNHAILFKKPPNPTFQKTTSYIHWNHRSNLSKICPNKCTSSAKSVLSNSSSIAKKNVGGFALSITWGINSAGTLDSDSYPKICSLGIHPEYIILFNQLDSDFLAIFGDHFEISSKWKPSSHRNPRGNWGLLGTAENSSAGSHWWTFSWFGFFTRNRPCQ